MEIHVAEIIDFEVQQLNGDDLEPTPNGSALSVMMKLKIGTRTFRFGGRNLFASMPNSDSLDLTGFFILRCMQVLKVSTTSEMIGEIIKVIVDGDQVVGICSLESDDYFYPVPEFENLLSGDDDTD